MGFLELLAAFVISAIITILLTPKPDLDQDPADFRPPEPREGEAIPVVWGTVKVSPSVVWFGDVGVEEVVKKESTLFGLVSTDIPLGYNYFAGMQLLICHGPVDSVIDLHIGEYHLVQTLPPRNEGTATGVRYAIPRSNTQPNFPIDRPAGGSFTPIRISVADLFGGPEEGGGIVGTVDWYWGTDTQGQNPYLAVWWGSDILPQYRGLCYAVLRRMNMGKSPSPQPWQFVVVRIPRVLGQDDYSEIIDADGNSTANPAECIYELLTNDVWGAKLDPDDLDLASFQTVAQTLHTEGVGYVGQMVNRQTAWSAIKTILQHVNGTLYQSPVTGQIGIMLIRADYTIASLPEFNESNCVLNEFRRGSWAEIINETTVEYTDIGRRFSVGSAQAQNLAAIQAMNGEVVHTDIRFLGFTTHELAQDAAARSNRASSVPITRGRLVCTRDGYDLHQGSIFKITFPHFGITDLPARVISINYGSLTENRIEIEFVEDQFNHLNPYGSPLDNPDNVFCGPLNLILPGYDPTDDPAAVFGEGEVYAFEAPYWLSGAARRVYGFCSRESNQDFYWVAYRSEGGALERLSPKTFNVMGALDADLAKTGAQTGVTLTVRNLGDMATLEGVTTARKVAGDRLAIIWNGKDAEIIAWETITNNGDGTFAIGGVWRGVLDTVPLNHQESARVFFIWNINSLVPEAYDLSSGDYAAGDYVQIRAPRVTIDGTEEDITTADFWQLTVGDRALAPHPPGKVTLNSNEYTAWPASTSGDVTLGWTHRSRTLQTDIVAQSDATAYTLEGTLTVEVLIDDKPVREFTGITGTSQVYTYAQRTADDTDLTKEVTFRITPIGAGGEVGIARVTPPFLMNA